MRAVLACTLAFTVLAAGAAAQQLQPLGAGPAWRRVRPAGSNEVFATADGCALCHSSHPRSMAMTGPTGTDVSPHALWQATAMANSARDPFWRAQVAAEVAADRDRGDEVQALCLRCHAPMHAHTRRLGGEAPVGVAEALRDPLAQDGVSCSMCHQIQAAGLGEEATFGGKGRVERGRKVFGPFEQPLAQPMRDFAGYEVTHGAHVQRAGLCATCHTNVTRHGAEPFPEQTPYFEWQNSEFSDENGRTAASRTCQECHMPDLGASRIARDPAGADFLSVVRSPYRSHAFVGGNASLLDLLADHGDALGVTAPVAALRATARATRRQLGEATGSVAIGDLVRADGELRFDVRVGNLAGHKFPTGFPSRRAWLHVQVRSGNDVAFDGGGWDRAGRILGIDDALAHPHATRVTSQEQVVVYELVAADAAGAPTTRLTRMVRRTKDTRLLPKGWRRDGPRAEATAPVGIGNDLDFTAGGDTVSYAIPYAAAAPGARVVAWLRYQAIAPHWVDALRDVDDDACRTFVAMYDAADKTPEVVAVAVREESR
jgi:cytochrome c2